MSYWRITGIGLVPSQPHHTANARLSDVRHSRKGGRTDWIIGRKHPAATGLPRNRRRRGVCITGNRSRPVWIDRRLGAWSTRAAVDVSDLDAPVAVNRHIEKVEQVSIDWATASAKQTHPLHRQHRRNVGSGPMRAAVKCVRDVQMPNSGELVAARITHATGRSVECNRSTTSISGYRSWESYVIDAIDRAHVIDVRPSLALVAGGCDHCCGAIRRTQEINDAITINADRRIVGRSRGEKGTVLDGPNGPGCSVIRRDDNRRYHSAARPVRHIDSSIRRNLDVTVQAAASVQIVDRN